MHRFSQTIGWTLPSLANFTSAISSPWQYVTNSSQSSEVCEVSGTVSWLNLARSQEERISCVDGRPYALRLICPPEFTPDNPKCSKVPISVTAAFVAGARRLSGLLFAPIHGPNQPVFGTRSALSTYIHHILLMLLLWFTCIFCGPSELLFYGHCTITDTVRVLTTNEYVSINSIWNLSEIFTSNCSYGSWDDNDMVNC